MSTLEQDLINNILSFDSLVSIMTFLPFSTRVVCERVCKHWKEVSLTCNAANQTTIGLFSKRFDVEKSSLQPFCNDSSHKICFTNDCVFANDEDCVLPVIGILSKCPNLKVLHFKCYEEEVFFTEGLENLDKYCPSIEHLSMADDTRGCYIYKDTITLAKNCSYLRHLQLKFPAEGTYGLLLENIILTKTLYMHYPTIEVLSTNLALNSDNCSILANECKRLEKLSLEGTSITLEGLALIATSPYHSLTELNVIIEYNAQLLLISQNMDKLQSFHCIISSSDVTNIDCIGNMTGLKTLFLSIWGQKPVDDQLIEIMKGCNQLTSLTVNGEVTDSSLANLSTFCPRIETLEVAMNSDSKSLSDVTIQKGLLGLNHLKRLALYHCNVSDDGVKMLLASRNPLNYLRLTCSKNISLGIIPSFEEFSSLNTLHVFNVILPLSLLDPFKQVSKDSGPQLLYPNLVLKFL